MRLRCRDGLTQEYKRVPPSLVFKRKEFLQTASSCGTESNERPLATDLADALEILESLGTCKLERTLENLRLGTVTKSEG
jgi:hypothetical protein